MKEPIVVPPRKCPNCAKEKMRIILDPKHPSKKPLLGQDWNCPDCEKPFCSSCFKVDFDGRGDTMFCPHCKTKLCFP